MKATHLALVLCLSLPSLAFAEYEATSAYPQHDEASAPAGPTTNDESSSPATEKILPVQVDEKYNHGNDPVPFSDYVNGGYYAE